MDFVSSITFAGIIGFFTLVFGILVKVIGFPAQIKKNHERKSTEGLSTTMIVLTLLAYILWTIHGFVRNDWVLIWGQGIGIITTGIILWQIMEYRRR
jgi:uncharacterized protein with PQ loop repeat